MNQSINGILYSNGKRLKYNDRETISDIVEKSNYKIIALHHLFYKVNIFYIKYVYIFKSTKKFKALTRQEFLVFCLWFFGEGVQGGNEACLHFLNSL